MNFITQEQLNLFQTFVNCFPFFQWRKRKKTRGMFWFINLLHKLVFSKMMLTKKSERETDCFCKGLEPRLGGGQKYSQNRSKSSNKRKCHEGWSLKTLRVVVLLRINNVGEYFEGPKRCQIAMDCKSWLEKPTIPKWKGKTILTQLQKWSQKDLIKSWWLLTKMANRQQKWIQWNWFLMRKSARFAMPFKVGPNGWPWKWTFNLWWWRGLLWGCLNPLRGGQVKAGKQGNKYFPVEKAWCLKPTSDKRDQCFYSLGRNSGWFTVNVSFAYARGGWKVSKCFLLRMRKPRITFFCFSKAKKRRLKGVHPNKNWKQLK